MEFNLPEPWIREQLVFETGVKVLLWGNCPSNVKLTMNFNRKSDNDEELTDSDSENEYSKKNNPDGMYEEVSDSDIDEKEHMNRMNDVGVVDTTYAQRTVWLVKVTNNWIEFVFIITTI